MRFYKKYCFNEIKRLNLGIKVNAKRILGNYIGRYIYCKHVKINK